MIKNNLYFKQLTGIRAIAAFMVYLHHYNPFPKGSNFHQFIQELHIGVTLFFVLSGFLIAFKYLDKENFNFRNYIINRFARIYPMYFILTTITFIIYYSLDYNELVIYGLNISLLKGFFDHYKFSGIAQGWSLTVEETFYILAPILFLLIRRNKINLIILPLVILTIGILLVVFCSNINFFGFFSNFEFMFNYTFFGRCTEFFIGISLALVIKNNTLKNFKYFTYLGIISIILSIFILIYLKGTYDSGVRHPIGKILNTFFLPLFGILTLYYGIIKEQTIISKILSSKIFVILGKSSYIFYLIHMGIFADIINNLGINALNHGYILNFILLNIISIILFKYIEEPINIKIRNYFTKTN